MPFLKVGTLEQLPPDSVMEVMVGDRPYAVCHAGGAIRAEGGAAVEVFSAGVKPSSVRPEAIAVMKEIGIDISGHRSKSVDEFSGQSMDYVVTVCDNARDACP